MDFAFSEEQDEFRATLRRFFEERSPSAETRRVMDTPEGYDPALWKSMAEELGLQGVALAEEHGGQGFGFLELGIVVEEMGRALLPGPFLASTIALFAIRNAASEAQKDAWLPALANGSEIASLALVEAAGRFDASGVAAEAVPDGDCLRVTGEKTYVLDGHVATSWVVVARAPGTAGEDGIELVRVRADAPGVKIHALETLDPLRRQARIEFADAPGERLAGSDAAAALRKTIAQACVLLAVEMVGATERALEQAVAHAKQRIQFGRPIGSFQAIKHKAAEMLLELELARSTAYWALWAADEDAPELDEAAHLAKALCADALRLASEQNIQIHGGVGFTWEYDAHLFYKRWQTNDALFGDAVAHRGALAVHLGL
jgi:alkylation response protein AidB-like acyl-CoA dehydrogenase